MNDPIVTAVVETDNEVEARVYEGMLNDAGILAQVRTVEEPLLRNVIRQLALPRYQVVVPNTLAFQAESLVVEYRQLVAETAPMEEEEPGEPTTNKRTLLTIGCLLIWLLLLASLITILSPALLFSSLLM